MKKIVVLLLLCPLLSLAQSKYSGVGKKLFKQATQAYSEGNIDEAVRLFKDCINQDPNFAEAHLNLATINYYRGRFDLALSYAKRAYNYNRYQPEVYVQLGKAYFQNGQYDSCVTMLSTAVTEFNNETEDVFLHLAKALNKVGNYQQAIVYLDKVIEQNPKSGAAYNERGISDFNNGDFESATADFNQALSLIPGEAGIYTNLANLAIANEDVEQAMEYIEKAKETATNKEQVQLLILQGNFYRASGDIENAENAYNRAFELDNNNAVVLNNQASIFIDKDNYKAAWEKSNRALELNNEMMEAYFNRGIANEMLRKTEEACLDWEQAFILGSEKAEEYLNSPTCAE